MDVVFQNEKLQRQFSEHRQLQARYGAVGAKTIGRRIQQLQAAPTLADMRNMPGRCHELTGDRAGQLAVDVHQPYRLIFLPTAQPSPAKADGGLDWNAVDSVTVLEIVDYH